jgi:hypothetical protein
MGVHGLADIGVKKCEPIRKGLAGAYVLIRQKDFSA